MNITPRLLTPYPREFQQLIRTLSDNFVGRTFIFSAITEFLHHYRRGYFTIIGAPGSGKSAILASYVTDNPQSLYYNAQVEGKNRADEFLVNICTQLLDLLGTREITSLPDNVTQGSWFLSLLLQKVSDLLEPLSSLIIAIDAVDAIDLTTLSPGSNLFYLPRYLPDRVYFLLARRPYLKDKTGFLVETPFETLDLEDYPEENRADVQAYIRQFGSRLHLPAAGDEEFIQQLTERAENNFMYLSQILPAIADVSPQLFDFTLLPPGLEAYYQHHWQRIQGEGLSDIELRILGTLTSQPESGGISVETISEIIDEDEYDVEVVLSNWIEFFRWQKIAGEICYRFYHHSFREFLELKMRGRR